MRSSNVRRPRGFTLIEVLVATVLIGVGVTASVLGLAALTSSRAKFLETERLRTLAYRKWDEIAQTAPASGFDDSGTLEAEGFPDLQYRAEGRDSGTPDLTDLAVTITNTKGRDEEVSGLIYRSPATTPAETP